MKSGLRRGQLKKWKDDRGFGFIQPVDGSPEVFLHISELKDATRRPQVGDTIYYHLTAEAGKIRACNAFILGARSKSQATAGSSSSAAKPRIASHAVKSYPFPVLESLLLSLLPLMGAIHFAGSTSNPIPLLLYPAMSALTFALYADDKSRAKRGTRRIPENTLHLCELAGGWLGGFVAQRRLHHKNRKKSYQTMFWSIVALHLAFWTDWLFLDGTLIKGMFGLRS